MTPDDIRSQLPEKHVPFIRLDAQGDVFRLNGIEWRREDSDDPDAGYRIYEITGAPHGPGFIMGYQPYEEDILKTGDLPSQIPYSYGGKQPYVNNIYRQYIEPAVYKNLEEWVINGTLPPKCDLIELNSDATDFAYDTHGNALGGLRSPAVDVPIARYYEVADAEEGKPFAWSFGYQENFSSQKLQELYGIIAPHQNYVELVTESVNKYVEEGFLLPEDGELIILQAQLTPIP